MSHAIAPSVLTLTLLATACGASPPAPVLPTGYPGRQHADLPRLRFNQLALRLDLPLFWAEDANGDGAVDPGELRSLLFYPTVGRWVEDGAFTPSFEQAYEALVRAADTAAPADERRRLVRQELDSTAPTLVYNDLRGLPEAHRVFAGHMRRVAALIDALYAKQVGMSALAGAVAADDPASQSLFRRNWGPRCLAPSTEHEAACSAIAGVPPEPVDVYPSAMQADEGFCQALEARPDSEQLLSPFTVVRERAGELAAVPYTEAYAQDMDAIATQLQAAADAMTDPDEAPLVRYLRAAAQSFGDNVWGPADEAWADMNAQSSRWYVRVAPDEVYWEPCSRKAGFHLTFALINRGSLQWQERLTPLQQDMEGALAALVPQSYEARDVSFHMPDFIDIVINAGDDRDAFGATVGQSLPNWGAVAEEGRGRTVAMSNLYTDADSMSMRRSLSSSLMTTSALAYFAATPDAGLMSTILHEATHNLGPAHEYRVEGRTSADIFGGPMSSMLEELKAQTGALYFLAFLAERGVIDERRQRETYLDSFIWALGHISRGMYTQSGHRKAYSQLSAIQVGFLMDEGVIGFDAGTLADNGEDHGAFSIDYDAFPAAAEKLMRRVMTILSTGDRAGAEALADRYVDGDTVPQAVVVERHRRFPKQSFVYAVDL